MHLPKDYVDKLNEAQESGTWYPLPYQDFKLVQRRPIRCDRKPRKDPRSECPCGGGLLRMDCHYHKDT